MSVIKPVGQAMPLPIADAFGMTGKVVIVTGAAGNIGSGIAEVFAANGANVVITDRAGEKLTNVATTLRSSYPGIVDAACDLLVPEQLKSLVDQTFARFGRLDALVNCGAIPSSGHLSEEDVPDFDRLFHTNVRSIWLLAKYSVEPMAKGGGGAVVNIASINAYRAQFMCALYAGTKSAVLAMTRELSVELAPSNIRVNSVSPGLIPNINHRMDWMMHHLNEPYATQIKEEFGPRLETASVWAQPLQLTGHGHDIGMACYYLCSPAARFVTGTDIVVDGGKQLEMPEMEQRFHNSPPAVYKAMRQRVFELPESAWKGEKPRWLTRWRSKAAT